MNKNKTYDEIKSKNKKIVSNILSFENFINVPFLPYQHHSFISDWLVAKSMKSDNNEEIIGVNLK